MYTFGLIIFIVCVTVSVSTVAGPSGRAVQGVGLRPSAYWDRGFESHRGHGCLSLVSVMACQVEVSVLG
jgi:hypothetical protein